MNPGKLEDGIKAESVLLAVDRNHRNLELLSQYLGREGYRMRTAATIEEFDQILGGDDNIGLALVDIAGFDRNIWERCEGLRHHRIPFLVISPKQSAAIQQASLTHGARGVLIKPLVVKELLGLIRSLLEEEADRGEAEG
jgi:DNA-binding response OmpR family regulator